MTRAAAKTRLGRGLTGIIFIVLLTGCGGALLGLALQLFAAGAVVGNIDRLLDEFEEDPWEYQAFLDGYCLGERPNTSGDLNLRGLPTGSHLISVIHNNYHTGFHTVVQINPGDTALPLGDINPIEGVAIKGKVQRQTTGTDASVPRTLVVAVLNGAEMLAADGGGTIAIPPPDGVTYVMAYADADGNYVLGPCISGQWLVTTVLPGYYADARVVTANRPNDNINQDLYLATDPSAEAARVSGSVIQTGVGGLDEAFVYTELAAAHRVQPTAARAAEIAADAGFPLINDSWFAWSLLGTLTDQAGVYSMRTGTGPQTVNGFKYGYQGKQGAVNLQNGENRDNIDFDLPKA
jgi:hypothetical protein